MSYGKTVTLDAPFTQTVTRVRDAHAEQGFGVLTEIDVTATMHAKLGKDLEDYLILGACNPPLAYQALGIDRSLGLLLPCNIVVRAADDGTIVEILDPQIMATLTDRPELKPVADRSSTPPRRRARRTGALAFRVHRAQDLIGMRPVVSGSRSSRGERGSGSMTNTRRMVSVALG